MRYISHRGNLKGPIPEKENSPQYIKDALAKGYDVEIDLWRFDNEFFLGHDQPQYPIDKEFLTGCFSLDLWIHCKNLAALKGVIHLAKQEPTVHYFWHETDRYTFTNHGWVISYPGRDACTPYALCMLPEITNSLELIPAYLLTQGFSAVCSDYIENIEKLNS